MLLIVLEMTRFVFSCVYHNFRVLLILLVWGNFFLGGGDIHMVGGKDWSFKIVVEKINAKDKWQLIKGCGSFFFERWIRMAEWHVFVYCRLIYQYNGLWTTGSGCAVPRSRTSKMSADRTAASTCQFDWPSE